ncbi:hypothetical protein [Clostridium sp.]|jgi:hypothetical protein|uniref:hypothetical protein n=1 Tax=Clostridium sp. TaxID=1506 RepID=UPI003EEFE10B
MNNIDYRSIKGMFDGCIARHGLSEEKDELLDITAALLIKTHKDNSILPIIVDTIFFRNREGLFNHDLIWSFFEARDPYSLMLIANYLHSDDTRDTELAYKLLDFVPSINMRNGREDKNQYTNLFYWIQENYRFLYFTGESFQRTSNPTPYKIDLDAKYDRGLVNDYSF